MSDAQQPGGTIADDPMIQQAFRTIGALLIATNSKHFSADFMMSGEDGKDAHQYHVEVTEIING